jgi:hypothetical protein
MSQIEFEDTQPLAQSCERSVLSHCPECDGELAVLRVISGRAGCEYWTMRCTHCGGIHLDIVRPQAASEHGNGSRPAA